MKFNFDSGRAGRRGFAVAVMFAALALVRTTRADLLELTNGDHYRGTVVSMTASNLEFISEIQGRVTLPRSKIAQITLHDVTPKPLAARSALTPSANAPLILSGPNSATAASQPAASAPASGSAALVVEQMRQQGVDPKLISQVQDQIFGKASPEAAARFNQLMGGLMSGQLTIKDIQAQAQNSMDQIRAAKKELGPEASEMLDGYLDILQKFVQEASADSTPPISQTPPPTPQIK